jgi:pimeloyl-ACP methyl ester carboxylesterase
MDGAVPPPPALQRLGLPGGVELHFIESGQGPALILLHGGMGDCDSWAPQLQALSPHHRTIAYSRRHSSPNRNQVVAGPQSLATDVADLLALLRQLHTGPAHLVGTSYGAVVALGCALACPAEVLSLVLAEPPLHRWACRTAAGAVLYAAFMDEVWRQAADAFERGRSTRALQLLVDGMWGRAVFASLPPARRAAALRNAEAMEALTRAADPFPDLPQATVARLPMPVLLVRGEHASALHVRVIDELARVLPSAARAVIADAGHAAPLENADEFNRVVGAFLMASAAPAPEGGRR